MADLKSDVRSLVTNLQGSLQHLQKERKELHKKMDKFDSLDIPAEIKRYFKDLKEKIDAFFAIKGAVGAVVNPSILGGLSVANNAVTALKEAVKDTEEEKKLDEHIKDVEKLLETWNQLQVVGALQRRIFHAVVGIKTTPAIRKKFQENPQALSFSDIENMSFSTAQLVSLQKAINDTKAEDEKRFPQEVHLAYQAFKEKIKKEISENPEAKEQYAKLAAVEKRKITPEDKKRADELRAKRTDEKSAKLIAERKRINAATPEEPRPSLPVSFTLADPLKALKELGNIRIETENEDVLDELNTLNQFFNVYLFQDEIYIREGVAKEAQAAKAMATMSGNMPENMFEGAVKYETSTRDRMMKEKITSDKYWKYATLEAIYKKRKDEYEAREKEINNKLMKIIKRSEELETQYKLEPGFLGRASKQELEEKERYLEFKPPTSGIFERTVDEYKTAKTEHVQHLKGEQDIKHQGNNLKKLETSLSKLSTVETRKIIKKVKEETQPRTLEGRVVGAPDVRSAADKLDQEIRRLDQELEKLHQEMDEKLDQELTEELDRELAKHNSEEDKRIKSHALKLKQELDEKGGRFSLYTNKRLQEHYEVLKQAEKSLNDIYHIVKKKNPDQLSQLEKYRTALADLKQQVITNMYARLEFADKKADVKFDNMTADYYSQMTGKPVAKLSPSHTLEYVNKFKSNINDFSREQMKKFKPSDKAYKEAQGWQKKVKDLNMFKPLQDFPRGARYQTRKNLDKNYQVQLFFNTAHNKLKEKIPIPEIDILANLDRDGAPLWSNRFPEQINEIRNMMYRVCEKAVFPDWTFFRSMQHQLEQHENKYNQKMVNSVKESAKQNVYLLLDKMESGPVKISEIIKFRELFTNAEKSINRYAGYDLNRHHPETDFLTEYITLMANKGRALSEVDKENLKKVINVFGTSETDEEKFVPVDRIINSISKIAERTTEKEKMLNDILEDVSKLKRKFISASPAYYSRMASEYVNQMTRYRQRTGENKPIDSYLVLTKANIKLGSIQKKITVPEKLKKYFPDSPMISEETNRAQFFIEKSREKLLNDINFYSQFIIMYKTYQGSMPHDALKVIANLESQIIKEISNVGNIKKSLFHDKSNEMRKEWLEILRTTLSTIREDKKQIEKNAEMQLAIEQKIMHDGKLDIDAAINEWRRINTSAYSPELKNYFKKFCSNSITDMFYELLSVEANKGKPFDKKYIENAFGLLRTLDVSLEEIRRAAKDYIVRYSGENNTYAPIMNIVFLPDYPDIFSTYGKKRLEKLTELYANKDIISGATTSQIEGYQKKLKTYVDTYDSDSDYARDGDIFARMVVHDKKAVKDIMAAAVWNPILARFVEKRESGMSPEEKDDYRLKRITEMVDSPVGVVNPVLPEDMPGMSRGPLEDLQQIIRTGLPANTLVVPFVNTEEGKKKLKDLLEKISNNEKWSQAREDLIEALQDDPVLKRKQLQRMRFNSVLSAIKSAENINESLQKKLNDLNSFNDLRKFVGLENMEALVEVINSFHEKEKSAEAKVDVDALNIKKMAATFLTRSSLENVEEEKKEDKKTEKEVKLKAMESVVSETAVTSERDASSLRRAFYIVDPLYKILITQPEYKHRMGGGSEEKKASAMARHDMNALTKELFVNVFTELNTAMGWLQGRDDIYLATREERAKQIDDQRKSQMDYLSKRIEELKAELNKAPPEYRGKSKDILSVELKDAEEKLTPELRAVLESEEIPVHTPLKSDEIQQIKQVRYLKAAIKMTGTIDHINTRLSRLASKSEVERPYDYFYQDNPEVFFTHYKIPALNIFEEYYGVNANNKSALMKLVTSDMFDVLKDNTKFLTPLYQQLQSNGWTESNITDLLSRLRRAENPERQVILDRELKMAERAAEHKETLGMHENALNALKKYVDFEEQAIQLKKKISYRVFELIIQEMKDVILKKDQIVTGDSIQDIRQFTHALELLALRLKELIELNPRMKFQLSESLKNNLLMEISNFPKDQSSAYFIEALERLIFDSSQLPLFINTLENAGITAQWLQVAAGVERLTRELAGHGIPPLSFGMEFNMDATFQDEIKRIEKAQVLVDFVSYQLKSPEAKIGKLAPKIDSDLLRTAHPAAIKWFEDVLAKQPELRKQYWTTLLEDKMRDAETALSTNASNRAQKIMRTIEQYVQTKTGRIFDFKAFGELDNVPPLAFGAGAFDIIAQQFLQEKLGVGEVHDTNKIMSLLIIYRAALTYSNDPNQVGNFQQVLETADQHFNAQKKAVYSPSVGGAGEFEKVLREIITEPKSQLELVRLTSAASSSSSSMPRSSTTAMLGGMSGVSEPSPPRARPVDFKEERKGVETKGLNKDDLLITRWDAIQNGVQIVNCTLDPIKEYLGTHGRKLGTKFDVFRQYAERYPQPLNDEEFKEKLKPEGVFAFLVSYEEKDYLMIKALLPIYAMALKIDAKVNDDPQSPPDEKTFQEYVHLVNQFEEKHKDILIKLGGGDRTDFYMMFNNLKSHLGLNSLKTAADKVRQDIDKYLIVDENAVDPVKFNKYEQIVLQNKKLTIEDVRDMRKPCSSRTVEQREALLRVHAAAIQLSLEPTLAHLEKLNGLLRELKSSGPRLGDDKYAKFIHDWGDEFNSLQVQRQLVLRDESKKEVSTPSPKNMPPPPSLR